jgi:hypothetical protein
VTQSVSVVDGAGVERNLDQLVAQGVEGVTGMLAVPGKRGSDLVVPGAHGELHIPAKRYNPANLVLPLWVRGVNADGTIPGGTDSAARLAFHANLRALVAMFVVDERVRLRHTLSDGSVREIVGEVTDVIEPQVSGRGRYTLGRLAIALRCASPFWSDLTDSSQVVTSGGPVTLTSFGGATAPMEDLQLLFGPQSNPRLTQASTGIFVEVGRVIAAGQTITVDTATWQVSGTGGVAAGLYEDLVYGGRGTSRWFALHPEPGGGAPVVELTETGAGTGQVTVTGRRRYKIG